MVRISAIQSHACFGHVNCQNQKLGSEKSVLCIWRRTLRQRCLKFLRFYTTAEGEATHFEAAGFKMEISGLRWKIFGLDICLTSEKPGFKVGPISFFWVKIVHFELGSETEVLSKPYKPSTWTRVERSPLKPNKWGRNFEIELRNVRHTYRPNFLYLGPPMSISNLVFSNVSGLHMIALLCKTK